MCLNNCLQKPARNCQYLLGPVGAGLTVSLCTTSGKPPTWFPLERLVEQDRTAHLRVSVRLSVVYALSLFLVFSLELFYVFRLKNQQLTMFGEILSLLENFRTNSRLDLQRQSDI